MEAFPHQPADGQPRHSHAEPPNDASEPIHQPEPDRLTEDSYGLPMYPVDAEPQPPTRRLFAPADVGIAAFLGGFVGGGLILAENYRRLGRFMPAVLAALASLFVIVGFIYLFTTIPELDQVPRLLWIVLSVVIMYGLAKLLQGALYDQHLCEGGQKASAGIAGIIGLTMGLLVYAGAWSFERNWLGQKVTFGPGEEIYYLNGAGETDARKLGGALRGMGFFDNTGPKTVQLQKSGDAWIVGFVVQDWVFDSPETIEEFRTLANDLSGAGCDGKLSELRLCNEYLIAKNPIDRTSGARRGLARGI